MSIDNKTIFFLGLVLLKLNGYACGVIIVVIISFLRNHSSFDIAQINQAKWMRSIYGSELGNYIVKWIDFGMLLYNNGQQLSPKKLLCTLV